MELSGLGRVGELISRRQEAEERFKANDRKGLFLALSGIETPVQVLHLADSHFTIEELVRPPAFGASERTLHERPRHQLAFPNVSFEEHSWMLGGAFWTIYSLLKLRCGGYFVACEASEFPWDTVDGVPIGAADPRFVTSARRSRWWPSGTVRVEEADAQWVGEQFMKVLDLRSNRKFHFAFECFSTAFEEPDVRMAISKAWAGIEGILGISSELRFRIALYCAGMLEPAGPDRVARFRAISKLYDQRSKVVHGADVESSALEDCIVDSLELLRELLLATVTRGEVQTPKQIEQALLGA